MVPNRFVFAMLGRLFGNAASSVSSVGYPRDSIVDEEYTRGLLYPNLAAQSDAPTQVPQVQAGRVGDFDDWSGLELDPAKGLRIMIAQDAIGDSEEPCILFDTHPIPQSESPTDLAQRIGSLQNQAHRRGGSTASTFRAPTSPVLSKPMPRLASSNPNVSFPMRNRSSTFSGVSDEHDPRHIRSSDSKEETRNILNCAFGSSSCASFGTKMHVLSLGLSAREPPVTPSSPGIRPNMSAGYFRKREAIARAHTSTLPSVRPAMHEQSHSSVGSVSKPTSAVLITKLFSVNLPEPTDPQASPSRQASQEGGATPDHADHSLSTKKKKPRAKKTPVFAIILVVQLPTDLSTGSRPASQGIMQAPPIYPSSRSLRSSFNSPSSSPKIGGSATPLDHGDARVNTLVEHWDIIDRALTSIENVSAPKILGHLKEVDSFSAALVSRPSKPKEKTMQRTNQINIYLAPLVLNSDPGLKDIAVQAVQRIQRALRIPRVVIGQGRWGLWNDEMIRIARYYIGRGQSLFISKLLTSFLGVHTAEWIIRFPPALHRRRYSISSRFNDPNAITARTVVISNDRSIARRLIFLLSSFLAGDALSELDGAFCKGSGASVSLRNAIRHSPAWEAPRKIQQNRSPERHADHSSDHSQGGLLISNGLHRTPSDAHSIKSIPIPANDLSIRKSSAVTVSTIIPNPTTPMPQFSSSSGPETGYLSDGSSASASLTKIWQNNCRDSDSSTASTKWGSLLSGFWSRESSTSASQSTAASISSSSIRLKKETPLNTMVKQVGNDGYPTAPALATDFSPWIQSSASSALPLNLHVDADKGVIDVDIGIPGFVSSSNESGLASPPVRNVRHISSAASFDSLASPKRQFSPRGGCVAQSRVAGFLPRFHPDYSLQAVKVSKSDIPDMMDKIKSAMLSEPYPREPTASGWVEVSTTLVANVQTASVKRLSLKRKVSRPSDQADNSQQPENASMEHRTAPRPIKSPSTTGSELVREEVFSYESIMDPDPVLVDAIDCILARDSTHGAMSISPAPFSHSRQTSAGTIDSHRISNKRSTFNNSRSRDDLSRGSPESLVVDALEDIVKTVEHDMTGGRKGQHLEIHINQESGAQITNSQGSALREGVRSWLLKEEHMAVW